MPPAGQVAGSCALAYQYALAVIQPTPKQQEAPSSSGTAALSQWPDGAAAGVVVAGMGGKGLTPQKRDAEGAAAAASGVKAEDGTGEVASKDAYMLVYRRAGGAGLGRDGEGEALGAPPLDEELAAHVEREAVQLAQQEAAYQVCHVPDRHHSAHFNADESPISKALCPQFTRGLALFVLNKSRKSRMQLLLSITA